MIEKQQMPSEKQRHAAYHTTAEALQLERERKIFAGVLSPRLRRIRFVARLLSVVASLVIALLVLELGVRVFAPQQLISRRPDIYIPEVGRGWHHAANLNTTVNLGEGEVHLYTDANGHRVGGPNSAPEQADYKILALGDSFVQALQVEDEQTMTARLAQDLSVRLGRTVNVTNTGVGGWDPNQYLMEAKLDSDRSKYDLALVFIYMPNDVLTGRADSYPARRAAARHPLRLPKKLSRGEFVNAWLYPIHDFLQMRSHLFSLVRNRFFTLLARVGLTAYYFPDVFLRSQASSPGWGLTADVCADIAKVSAAHGANAVFVLIPGSYQVDESSFKHYQEMFKIDSATVDLDQPARLLTSEFQARGLTVLDTTTPLREAYASGRHHLYGQVDNHFAPDGHEVVAHYIADFITKYAATQSRR